MGDSHASTSHPSSALPDKAAPCPDAPGAERRSAPERRSPAGLPILSTEPLTEAERQKLLDLQWRCRSAALEIELCLGIGRVDAALDTLQSLSVDVGGRSAEIAATLGSHR